MSAATIVGDGLINENYAVTDEYSKYVYFYCIFTYNLLYSLGPESQPVDFKSMKVTSSYIIYSWFPPVKPNGVITAYQLECSGEGQEYRWTVRGSQTTTTLRGLLPYTNYSCSITAHTSVGGGPAEVLTVQSDEDSM